jgi:serpin B
MTYAGARGETAAQMAKTLHFTLPPERLHPAFGGLTQWLTSDGQKGPNEVNIANALWAQQGIPFVHDFLDVTRKSHRAGLHEVDFAREPNQARDTINRWIEQETRDKIKDLLQPGDVSGTTRLVLSNAIYFRGDWESPFDLRATHDADFETTLRSKVKVRMMRHSPGFFRHVQTQKWEVLELPYAGGRLAMVVMLPRKRCSLYELEGQLTYVEVQHLLTNLVQGDVEVLLPKFHFASRSELGPVLCNLGMPLAFGAADFSGMTPRALQIGNVIHASSVELTEVGTVAAAATVVMMTVGSASPQPLRFQVDHPCLFLIRDTQAGALLFLGRCANPTIGH